MSTLVEDQRLTDAYFRSTPPPEYLNGHRERVEAFLAHHRIVGRCVAIVTSGGTTVPLERHTVRFLDNFSTGARGAASVERLLAIGYAVVYVHRPGSIAPFARHLQRATRASLDDQFLHYVDVPIGSSQPQHANEQQIRLLIEDAAAKTHVIDAVRQLRSARASNTLLSLPFTSVADYFAVLQMLAACVAPWKERALFLLAAAVSDFYIPQHELTEHKIQSRAGPLTLTLQQVPKMLGVLRRQWAPQSFVVSFKLETDRAILCQKARQAIDKYAVHVVIANELHSRFDEVLLITETDQRLITRPEDEADLEGVLMEAVARLHYQYIASHDVSIPEEVGSRVSQRLLFNAWKKKLPVSVQSLLCVLDKHKEEILGVVAGGLLSVLLNSMLQRRYR
ncbi:unnamed protein product [Hyaloperonospora brassicae]|uniref:DNA/pantothenate metabolism flavoprotein C-terminal domain-containing protein n=1 Tax=Hyaloperonospora brassicae TaxID=162125 RepID=A0AAV0V3J0_HYABA|nr:unnamed protein product [Hyaloperonospora brassicae]